MAYKILGIDFSPSVELVNYATVTQEHKDIALPLVQAFRQDFEKNVQSAEEAVEKMHEMSAKCIADAIDSIIAYLCEDDIFSENHHSFFSRLKKT